MGCTGTGAQCPPQMPRQRKDEPHLGVDTATGAKQPWGMISQETANRAADPDGPMRTPHAGAAVVALGSVRYYAVLPHIL